MEDWNKLFSEADKRIYENSINSKNNDINLEDEEKRKKITESISLSILKLTKDILINAKSDNNRIYSVSEYDNLGVLCNNTECYGVPNSNYQINDSGLEILLNYSHGYSHGVNGVKKHYGMPIDYFRDIDWNYLSGLLINSGIVIDKEKMIYPGTSFVKELLYIRVPRCKELNNCKHL